MKTYPSIEHVLRKGVPVYLFGKIDGSNIRAEWARNRGWYKFGRRNGLLDDSNPILLEAPGLIFEHYADDLARIFTANRWDRVISFFEFAGPSSFAGNHTKEPHSVTLFDVSVHPKGLLEPNPFLKLFGDLPAGVAPFLCHGNFTDDIQKQIEDSTLPGMPFEGVVAKGSYVSPGMPLMFKYKSRAWLDKLKTYCGDNEKLFLAMR